MESTNTLYERSYDLYQKAVALQKGFFSLNPLTPAEFRRLSLPSFRPPQEIIAYIEQPIFWFNIFCQGKGKGLCEELIRYVCSGDELFVKEVLNIVSIEKLPTLSSEAPLPSPLPDSSKPQEPKESVTQAASPAQPQKKHKKKKKWRETSKTTPHAMKCASKTASCATKILLSPPSSPKTASPIPDSPKDPAPLPCTLQTLSSSLSDSLPKDQATEKVDALSSLIPALEALHISDDAHSEKPPQHKAPKEQPFEYRVAKFPILDQRVRHWTTYTQQKSTLPLDQWESVVYHSYPIFLTRIIQAHTLPTPWVSKTSGHVNQLYSCVGAIRRYSEGLPPVFGSFGDCFDKDILYHHFFKPTHQKSLIAQYVKTGSFADGADDPNPPEETQEKGDIRTPEADSPSRYQIQVRRYSLILNDTRAGIEYTVAFPTPLQKT
jgi:hypothetical protein